MTKICSVRDLHHRYGDHTALAGVELDVSAGEVVAMLGPNGSGKTTLFRLLCTLLPIQQGTITIDDVDAKTNPLAVRSRIGIVFQSPGLDKKLTVDENIACQAALYGLTGDELDQRRDELLLMLDLTDRRSDLCEKLSGGLKRRVELAKGMLHQPPLLLLDEPSTGLDPSARLSLWNAIRSLADSGMAVVLTTHLLEEADKADRVAILADGKKIAEGSPAQLRGEMGQTIVTITTSDTASVLSILRDEMGLDPTELHHQIRLHTESPKSLLPELMDRLGDQAESISVGKPSLEDVFVAKTGQSFDAAIEVSP
ncbi:Daunorubicin/doxorubicin resistance ATP-binding protein DrrA [Rubripirellula obstinata]|uniref:Daunorubicin/doxorubicin resistance ATP-binding protein DrrA n=1 Tax=Rubripirellula obstinata TaxID=406547 RepID=A0A5B1CKI9_9BACT|nr:ABC transporter ATP-binding protein [Rubripirellula obstinata]KAA1260395.1 Daunorubicin/doxorubicin resistance ATP-binding protein DrrA [Rubripirellula obstinata]